MKNNLAKVIGVAVAVLSCANPVVSSSQGLRSAPYNRHKGALARRNDEIEKRGFSGGATWYVINTGNQVACGGFYQPHDWVVAMNHEMFDSSNPCGKTITISYQGNSQHATVVDRCAGCPYGYIDLTEGLFESFASTAVGEIFVEWSFGSGAAPPPPPPPPPPPKPKPTHTNTPPPPPPTTTSTHSSTHSHTSSSTTSSSSSLKPSATLPAVPIPTGANNIASLLNSIVDLGALIAVAAGIQVQGN